LERSWYLWTTGEILLIITEVDLESSLTGYHISWAFMDVQLFLPMKVAILEMHSCANYGLYSARVETQEQREATGRLAEKYLKICLFP
jgi:hypothetical protein